jgi:hypothetical protein
MPVQRVRCFGSAGAVGLLLSAVTLGAFEARAQAVCSDVVPPFTCTGTVDEAIDFTLLDLTNLLAFTSNFDPTNPLLGAADPLLELAGASDDDGGGDFLLDNGFLFSAEVDGQTFTAGGFDALLTVSDLAPGPYQLGVLGSAFDGTFRVHVLEISPQ